MNTFDKYQGTGNDFIMIDDRDESFPSNNILINANTPNEKIYSSFVHELCDRRFGIGADGLILIRNHNIYDFEMIYYNSDGRIGSMCGNGGRCAVRFAESLGIFENETRFNAVDGEHTAQANSNEIFLKMGQVHSFEHHQEFDFMNTGSPHHVIYVKDVEVVDVIKIGREIRYSKKYEKEEGTNVNFVQIINSETLKVRTYERGVEDETYSCGTGVTACALSANLKYTSMKSPIKIITKGGNLRVSFEADFQNIYLIGPAKRVFQGILPNIL